ncbi:PLDc N-terminal domain-containing protein [Halomarina oriensis]|uniref:Uncharacterized protein n=1 Tax=Halomarina oriensis TaxID=671145 RepID=A0A6B0GTD2_9EURY|nr:PLDc N-terminal domain-containing protein [Halomarina oriensis]MWG34978.1 hypothetical protein [Halomarina oriensis]
MEPVNVAIILLNIAIAVVLFKDATRHDRFAPLWGVVGLVFGFFGALFYFSYDVVLS